MKYPCSKCNKSFDSKLALSGHQSYHSVKRSLKKCKFCEMEMISYNLTTHEKACIHNPINHKSCVECGEQIFNKDNKFCNQSCAASFNNRKYPKRDTEKIKTNCLSCDKEYLYHPLREHGKYCSIQCQKDYEKKERVAIIESGGIESITKYEPTQRGILKKYLIWKHGEKCMKCGWCKRNKWTNKIPIQIEHKDGNPHNQSLDNLELLCPSCHSLTEHFGARGKGRKGMIRVQMKTKKEYMKEVYEGEI